MLEGRSLVICMYPSSCEAFSCMDFSDEVTLKNLHLGKIHGNTWVVLNQSLDRTFDMGALDWNWLKESLTLANQNNLSPILFTNHECIKYKEHENHSIKYNILDILDKHCVETGIKNLNLIDAGMHFNPGKIYQTEFKKHIANIWMTSDDKPKTDIMYIQEWVEHDKLDKQFAGQRHAICDLSYVKYPLCNLMSRFKLSRQIFYVEAKRLGFWDNNPNLTFCALGQSEVIEETSEGVILTRMPEVYKDDPFATEILLNFDNKNQLQAPAEMYMDMENSYPFSKIGLGLYPLAPRTYQDSFITLSAESETSGDYMLITEKTTLPMLHLQPVCILGQKGIHGFMESLGFDMFKDIINYDEFDQIEDVTARTIAQTNTIYNSVIKDFNNVLQHWKNKEDEMQERLCNNYKKIKKLMTLMNMNTMLDPTAIVDEQKLNSKNLAEWLRNS